MKQINNIKQLIIAIILGISINACGESVPKNITISDIQFKDGVKLILDTGLVETDSDGHPIKIKDFEIQLAKGVTIIKKSSKGKVKFLEKNLRKDIEEKITTLLSSTKKGKYLLSYLVGTVNKKDVSEIAVEKM